MVFPLFEKLTRLYVNVTISQFRDLRVIKREKGRAPRKKSAEKKMSNDIAFPSMTSMYPDTSNEKTVTHLKMKISAVEN